MVWKKVSYTAMARFLSLVGGEVQKHKHGQREAKR